MKELKELVAFGLSAGEFVAGLADGFSFDDIKKGIEVAKLAGPGLKDAKAALGEYQAMTDEQAKELEDFVVMDFDIADDGVEMAIESALKIVISLHDLANLLPKP